MIIRKPYAFLIKYFKIIHTCMFILFTYLLFPLRKIYIFFKDYVSTSHFTYIDNMPSIYLNTYMYIIVAVLLISAIAIYFLMHKKEKPILFYRIMIIYTFILLVMLIVYNSFFSSLEFNNYDNVIIVIYRDMTGFLYYINYFYIGFTFARGFGFDIKKFSFDKDLKQLNITAEDNEEYELSLNIDREDIIKGLRKEKREFGYYFRENALMLSIIGLIVLIIGLISIYFKVFVPNKIYQKDTLIQGYNLDYVIGDSYLTDKNKYNEVISSNDYFVAVSFKVTNNTTKEQIIDKSYMRLNIDDNYIYPIHTYYSSFNDIGKGYNNQKIKPNTSENYILVYKFNKDLYKNNMHLELLANRNNNEYKYKKVNLEINLENKNENDYSINDLITIDDGIRFYLKKYQIDNRVPYIYEECLNNKCEKYTKMILPKNNDIILSLNLDYVIDDNIANYFENYLGVSYTINDKEYFINSLDTTISYTTPDTIYLSVNKKVVEASKISLVINSRSHIYKINIKE